MVRWNRYVSTAGARRLVLAFGGLYVAIAVGWALTLLAGPTSPGTVAIVTLMIGGPGLVLLAGGYRLPRTDVDPRYYPAVAGRSVSGLAAMSVLLALYHLQPDDSLHGSLQTILILTSLATAAGFGLGIYDGRAKTRARELTERNRELRRTKRRLEETVAELEASNERLEEFAHAASHDLQEPLRMVSSYLRLLETRHAEALDDDAREFLDYAVDGADRMREMVDGLLAYSRVETRGESLESVDLEAVLEAVRQDLRVALEESEAEVTADALPRVRGDERQLRQVLQNLVTNALEYSEDGPPRVHVSARRRGADWVISVADEGVGIDPDEHDRIFEVFQRLHTHEEHPGTGIGLALCQRIVERHGGEIWVESEPGVGSTFSFSLRAADAADDRVSAVSDRSV